MRKKIFNAKSPRTPLLRPRPIGGGGGAESWNTAADWYQGLVGEKGMGLQQSIVFPRTKTLLALTRNTSLVDIACGQGAFLRHIVRDCNRAVGIDGAARLIEFAKHARAARPITYITGDVTKPLPEQLRGGAPFDAASCILAIQNIEALEPFVENCAKLVKQKGVLVIVMTHPCFRIPRQSSWGWDEQRKIQYRRIDRYFTDLKIPIQTHPGARPGHITWTYHRPLSAYIGALAKAGFHINALEEWTTDRISTPGPRAKADQRSKQEIPLFLALRAIKQ